VLHALDALITCKLYEPYSMIGLNAVGRALGRGGLHAHRDQCLHGRPRKVSALLVTHYAIICRVGQSRVYMHRI